MAIKAREDSDNPRKGKTEVVARLRLGYGMREMPYLWGYLTAGQVLIEWLRHDPRSKAWARGADFLVYPIVQCYRHHYELYLKCLLRDAQRFASQPVDWKPRHSLTGPWSDLRNLPEKFYQARERYRDFDKDVAEAERLQGVRRRS